MAAPKTLILMRHATAGQQGGYRDHDRTLTPAGVADATAAGQWLRQSLPPVDAVLCSTAARTRQTLAAMAVTAPARFIDELYGGGIDDILGQIALLPDSADTALVVGHAPGIPATAQELATVAALARNPDEAAAPPETEELRHFSACAVAVLRADVSWAELAEHGADVVTVRHPDR